MTAEPQIDLAPRISDEIRKTTCYMCACRCGIDVHIRDGEACYIEGNRDHPVNRGVLCGKGAAGIMQHLSPARLRAPLRRVGPRGSGEFEEISWEEALATATGWLAPLRETAPETLAFYTGRDQSQSFTGWWAQAFGTPNYAAHGGFCSVNMAAAGIYTMGGSFWEFGQPDWDHARLFLLFGCAEDHDSNPIKMGIGRLKARGARIVAINPIRTGYNAVADDWLGITPGTDGLFVLSLVHCLLEAGKIDLDYLARWTDAGQLLDADGMILRDAEGRALVIDRTTGRLAPWETCATADLAATHDGAVPVLHRIVARYLAPDHAPEAVAGRCGIPAARIRALAAELARTAFDEAVTLERPWTDFRGHRHERMVGRPVAIHAMRGISAHANGFQTCRAIHLLQILLGAVETPGSFRFKPPYPKPATAHPRPHATARPGAPLAGPHLGYPQGPEDLCLDAAGRPQRLDKAFTWENPLSAHGMMHMAIANAHAGDPYPVDTLFLYMANMAWNSSMSTPAAIRMLSDRTETGAYVIPHVIVADAYSSEMVAFADLVLPDTTYLERHDCISLLDRPIGEADAAADGLRWPVVDPRRPGHAGVRGFQSVLLDIGHRLGLPGMTAADGTPLYTDYADYMARHERRPGIGPLAGFRGDGTAAGRGAPNPGQIQAYIDNGGFWTAEVPEEAAYFKPWNAAYQVWATDLGLQDRATPYAFTLYAEPLRRFQRAAEGHGAAQPPDHLRARIAARLDPLPLWYAPDSAFDSAFDGASKSASETAGATHRSGIATPAGADRAGAPPAPAPGPLSPAIPSAPASANTDYPLHALTQRPMAMYHSWGSQNAWLRQIHGINPLYVPTRVWTEHGFADGDWACLASPHGTITVPAAHMAALNPHTVWTWNAIGKRPGAWALDPAAPEATRGFLLNTLISELLPARGDGRRWSNSDPVTGQAAWFDLRVRIARVPAAAVSRRAGADLGHDRGRQASPVPAAPRASPVPASVTGPVTGPVPASVPGPVTSAEPGVGPRPT